MSGFQKLRRHAIFPVLVFIVGSYAIKDNYPFSHFPMYSRPSPKPISYYYVADGDDQPLRLLYHTGLTASRLAKIVGSRKGKHEAEGGLSEERILFRAGDDVLGYLRDMNAKRIKTRPFPETIRLVRVLVSLDDSDDGFSEAATVIAEHTLPTKP